jgi:uncharacterized membrane protein YczE
MCSAKASRSIRLVRTLIEVTVLPADWLLGGSVGGGTVLYALAVGPAAQFFMPWFAYGSAADMGCSRRDPCTPPLRS